MAEARASHLRLVVTEPAVAPSVRTPRLRLRPVMRLEDGAAFGMHVETEFNFEDTCRPHHMNDGAHPSSAAWLGDVIERAARMAHETGCTPRPLSITAPMAALSDPDTAMAAEAGARRTNILPQEIRIDFIDASVVALEDLALDKLDAIRARGFRIGLDARRGWRTPMGARARMTFEAIRLDARTLQELDIPMSRLEVAAAEGLALIAENAAWRDGPALANVGIHFGMAPRSDA